MKPTWNLLIPSVSHWATISKNSTKRPQVRVLHPDVDNGQIKYFIWCPSSQSLPVPQSFFPEPFQRYHFQCKFLPWCLGPIIILWNPPISHYGIFWSISMETPTVNSKMWNIPVLYIFSRLALNHSFTRIRCLMLLWTSDLKSSSMSDEGGL